MLRGSDLIEWPRLLFADGPTALANVGVVPDREPLGIDGMVVPDDERHQSAKTKAAIKAYAVRAGDVTVVAFFVIALM